MEYDTTCLICDKPLLPEERFYCSGACRKTARLRKAEVKRHRKAEVQRHAVNSLSVKLRSPKTERGEFINIPGNTPCVYYCWAGFETLLYIGKSKNGVFDRLGDHEANQTWWPEVRRVQWVACRSETEALALEKFEIQNLHPLYNTAYNYDPVK